MWESIYRLSTGNGWRGGGVGVGRSERHGRDRTTVFTDSSGFTSLRTNRLHGRVNWGRRRHCRASRRRATSVVRSGGTYGSSVTKSLGEPSPPPYTHSPNRCTYPHPSLDRRPVSHTGIGTGPSSVRGCTLRSIGPRKTCPHYSLSGHPGVGRTSSLPRDSSLRAVLGSFPPQRLGIRPRTLVG